MLLFLDTDNARTAEAKCVLQTRDDKANMSGQRRAPGISELVVVDRSRPPRYVVVSLGYRYCIIGDSASGNSRNIYESPVQNALVTHATQVGQNQSDVMTGEMMNPADRSAR